MVQHDHGIEAGPSGVLWFAAADVVDLPEEIPSEGYEAWGVAWLTSQPALLGHIGCFSITPRTYLACLIVARAALRGDLDAEPTPTLETKP